MSAKRKPDEPVGEMWSPEDAAEDVPRDVDWSTWFCDAHRPIQSHAKGMCFVCNALKLMREGEDAHRCEHGVLAGEHCSVCGTLSDPATPLHELPEKWRRMARLEYDDTFGYEVANKCADELEATLRAATPPGPTIREVCEGQTRTSGYTYRCEHCGLDGVSAQHICYARRDHA